jgi:hypothetical protein
VHPAPAERAPAVRGEADPGDREPAAAASVLDRVAVPVVGTAAVPVAAPAEDRVDQVEVPVAVGDRASDVAAPINAGPVVGVAISRSSSRPN